MPKAKKNTANRAKKAKPSSRLDIAPSASVRGELFARVVAILELARSNVVQAVNSNMVQAYWLIGREIVQEIQGGQRRAAYGKAVVADLSKNLAERYGGGFSETNIKHFRTFYLVYKDRSNRIRHPLGDESVDTLPVSTTTAILLPRGDEPLTEFSPQLSWSHYRALMRVQKNEARKFYEHEAIAGGWDKRTLERQIHSFYYERLLKSQHSQKMLASGREALTTSEPAVESLKNPYVLEFLGLPEVAALHESDLERAILSYLQSFLLELGKGFAFVARQKRLRYGNEDRYVDLVFYHCKLKFYLLIDLKLGELSHGDVGQIDGYVRMFDDQIASADDNPTIGLILCTEKNETVAKYSVLKNRKQIFASKYMLYLPTEDELRAEIQRERRMIEEAL